MFTKILFPTDGSEISRQAAEQAVALARALGIEIVAFHSIPPFSMPISDGVYAYEPVLSEEGYLTACRQAARQMTGEVQALAAKAGVKCEVDIAIAPAAWSAVIEAAASNRCDLIVMASHGRRGLAGVVLGSETTKVLTHSKVPVLVCR